MDVNIAPHSVDIAHAVITWFAAGQPEYPGQYTVPLWKPDREFRSVELAGRATSYKYGIFRLPSTYFGANDMTPKWCTETAFVLTYTIACTGDSIRMVNNSININ